MSEILVFVGIVSLLVLLGFYYRLRTSKLAHLGSEIPGPKTYPIIGNALEFGSTTVDFLRDLQRLWKEYGPVFRVWLGPKLFIVVSDPKYAENILSSSTEITKSMTYRFLEPWLGKGLLTSTGSKWRHRRKIITPTFHFKILEDYIDVFNTNGSILVEKLKKVANGEEFDIYNYINLCTLDIICESAMGIQMNLQNDGNSEYVAAVKGLADVVMKRAFSPWLFLDIIFNMTKLGREQKKYLKILHGTTEKVILARKRDLLRNNEKNDKSHNLDAENDCGQKKRLAFLDLLLQYNKDGANLSHDDIREEVDTFMFEGHDTTTSGITFCLWNLAKHQDIQEKVYNEIFEIFGNSDRECTAKDLQDMKYLELVIKESQRIYPSVPMIGRELEKDIKIEGLLFPTGTNVMILPILMHHQAEYFPDPDKCDPERFSSDAPHNRNPYAFVPFSAGPRNCIGQRFAMMEMKSAVSKVIRHFKIAPGSKELVLSAELVLRSWEGVFVKLETRK